MNRLKKNSRFLQGRLFFAVLPAMVISSMSLVVWLMGRGKKQVSGTTESTGLNLQLPDAAPNKEAPVSKLSFYEAAEADSLKKEQELKDDPYLTAKKDTAVVQWKAVNIKARQPRRSSIGYHTVEHQVPRGEMTAVATKEADPELEQLSQMLDKIKEIQDPQSVVTITNRKKNLSLPLEVEETDNSFFGKHSAGRKGKTFLSGTESQSNVTVIAVIEQSQKVQPGSVIKMRTLSEFCIQNILLPIGTSVFGIASIEHERMKIEVPSIRKDNKLFPVSLSVYDMDGLQGIYVPGSVSRDVAKIYAGDGLQSLNMNVNTPSVKWQLLNTGIGAVKSLFTTKVKQVSVTLPAGYRVLLHDEASEKK